MQHFGSGVFPVRAFGVAGRYGWQLSQGLEGAGRQGGGTLLQQTDHTSRSKKLVPTKKGTTNPLYALRTTATKGVVVAGFTLDGGDQGHLFNGIRIEKTRGPIMRDVCVVGIPGNSDVPPGETFDVNFWRAVGPVIHDVELDGRGVGASGIGYNSCSGGSTTLVTAHHHPVCKGIAFWQHTGGHVIDRFESLHNAFGIGFERVMGEVVMRNCKFVGSTRADLHVANDQGRGRFHLIDPDLGADGRLKVLLSKTEMGKPNKQRAEDVRLTIAGRDRRDLIDFTTRA